MSDRLYIDPEKILKGFAKLFVWGGIGLPLCLMLKGCFVFLAAHDEAESARLQAVHRPPIEYNLSKVWEIPPDLQWVKIKTHSRPFTIQSQYEEPCFIVRYKMKNGLFWTKKHVTDGGGKFVLTDYTYPPHNDIVEIQVRQMKSVAERGQKLRLETILNRV